ncbi:MAG: XshC-Cox1 family protein [Bacteroidetes bacterium]|nr:MAG: XshC-Cox1 family protein [Bacteroidota bacterium]
MKEITNIVEVYESLKNTPARLVLATVIDIKGSSYRRTGARMLIQDNGEYHGGISGGCIEGNALKKAHLALSKNKAIEVTYDTSKDNEAEIGVSLGCNGVISVLITPIDIRDPNNAVEQLRSCLSSREPTILITVLESDGDSIEAGQVIKYISEGALEKQFGAGYQPELDKDIQTILANGKSKINVYKNCKLFLEHIPPSTQIVIMGGNYDVYPLLKITDSLNWQSVIVANPKRLAHNIHQLANQVVTDFNDVNIDQFTVAILMSHDYNADLRNLEKVLKSDIKYIGLLGPASRKQDMLADMPFTINKSDEDRIFGPAGLDLGASQPEEIAISIVAEVLSVMRQRPGTSLRDRQGPIYDR